MVMVFWPRCPGPPVETNEQALRLLEETVLSDQTYRGTGRLSYKEQFLKEGGTEEMFREAEEQIPNNRCQPPRYYSVRDSKNDPENTLVYFKGFIPGPCENCWKIVNVSALLSRECGRLYDISIHLDDDIQSTCPPTYWPPKRRRP
jgi:hypothetical protein